MNKKVAVLLVLYNEEHHIPRLARSLNNQSYKNIQVYAIDNNSKDNSVALLKEHLPQVKLTLSDSNNGFAKGNNIIAAKAVADAVEYLFVLNTDMDLDENCIEELLNLAENDINIGGVAPVILYGKNNERTDLIQCYADNANFQTGKTSSLHAQLKFSNNKLPEQMQVNTISGGATFIKRELYEKIGLFNEENFMYGDEMDLAFRVKQQSYKLFVTKKAMCWHFHNWSKGNKQGYYFQYFYIMRNRFLFFHRYHKYKSMTIELFKELIIFPLKIRWALKRADIKLVKFYYLGILHGLLNKKGKANVNLGK
ncbi:MAG: glycosyltransferase family 2 protein [Candidatus Cloacimonetes bacterium]|nr:glycosyltransferase family 2 protein [Candidatus Cloacimonadota bacterium]